VEADLETTPVECLHRAAVALTIAAVESRRALFGASTAVLCGTAKIEGASRSSASC